MNDFSKNNCTIGSSHIHLDVLGGIAGDMFIAALLDAHHDLAAGTVDTIRAAGLPNDWDVELVPAKDGGFVGSRMKIGPGGPVDNGHEHHHYHYHNILKSLATASLAEPVRCRAMDILRLIAEAEAHVHGIDIENVELHEVGALDSLADVVGAAHLIEEISPTSWSMSSLPVGGGIIQSAHGLLPLPAPATQKLLEGFPFIDDGVPGERITPTGAAILRHLDPTLKMPGGILKSTEVGQGFGTRSLPGIANMLRVRFYEYFDAASTGDQVAVIEFMIDDQTSEDLANGLNALRKIPGVLEVLQIPTVGKKGRFGQIIQVLSTLESLENTKRACFTETTTIGLRERIENRALLPRREETSPDGLAVKVVKRPGGLFTAKTASDDICTLAQGHHEREQLGRLSEVAILTEGSNGRKE